MPPEPRARRQPPLMLVPVRALAFNLSECHLPRRSQVPQLCSKRWLNDLNEYRPTLAQVALNGCHDDPSGTPLCAAQPTVQELPGHRIDQAPHTLPLTALLGRARQQPRQFSVPASRTAMTRPSSRQARDQHKHRRGLRSKIGTLPYRHPLRSALTHALSRAPTRRRFVANIAVNTSLPLPPHWGSAARTAASAAPRSGAAVASPCSPVVDAGAGWRKTTVCSRTLRLSRLDLLCQVCAAR